MTEEVLKKFIEVEDRIEKLEKNMDLCAQVLRMITLIEIQRHPDAVSKTMYDNLIRVLDNEKLN